MCVFCFLSVITRLNHDESFCGILLLLWMVVIRFFSILRDGLRDGKKDRLLSRALLLVHSN